MQNKELCAIDTNFVQYVANERIGRQLTNSEIDLVQAALIENLLMFLILAIESSINNIADHTTMDELETNFNL